MKENFYLHIEREYTIIKTFYRTWFYVLLYKDKTEVLRGIKRNETVTMDGAGSMSDVGAMCLCIWRPGREDNGVR